MVQESCPQAWQMRGAARITSDQQMTRRRILLFIATTWTALVFHFSQPRDISKKSMARTTSRMRKRAFWTRVQFEEQSIEVGTALFTKLSCISKKVQSDARQHELTITRG